MILNLRVILVEKEGLKEGDTICPYLSRFAVAEKPMSDEAELHSFAVVCVGDKCGRLHECQNVPGVPLR